MSGVVGLAVYRALRALLPPLATELVFDVPMLVVVVFMVELVGNPLRGARQQVRSVLPEPVWHVDVLASIEPRAGRALGQALAAMAEAQGATLLAEADGRARVCACTGQQDSRRPPLPRDPGAMLLCSSARSSP